MTQYKNKKPKKVLAQAHNHLMIAVKNLLWLHQEYNDTHPIYGQLLRSICTSIKIATEGIEAFSMHAWGKIPSDWNDWREYNDVSRNIKQTASYPDDISKTL